MLLDDGVDRLIGVLIGPIPLQLRQNAQPGHRLGPRLNHPLHGNLGVCFFDGEAPYPDAIRASDVIWIQASARKCAEQLALDEQAVSRSMS